MKKLPEGQECLMVGISREGRISGSSLGSGQINRIYKRMARSAELDELVVQRIGGHSMRVGAANDLLNTGANMPIIMQRGRWSKTHTVMRYLEHSGCASEDLTIYSYTLNPHLLRHLLSVFFCIPIQQGINRSLI